MRVLTGDWDKGKTHIVRIRGLQLNIGEYENVEHSFEIISLLIAYCFQ